MWEGASYNHKASEMNHEENIPENQNLQENKEQDAIEAHFGVSFLTLGSSLSLVSPNIQSGWLLIHALSPPTQQHLHQACRSQYLRLEF